MKAKDMKDIKGIYYSEETGNVYFVVEFSLRSLKVKVNPVRCGRPFSEEDPINRPMLEVLTTEIEIPWSEFKEYKFSGNYNREDINQ
jgi:hypothetical protein